MKADQNYLGTIQNESGFIIYKVDQSLLSGSGFLMIEFASCLGDAEYVYLNNPTQVNAKS